MFLRFLFILLLTFACKPAANSVVSSDSENLTYNSEDVKWAGYFTGFAMSQTSLSPDEGPSIHMGSQPPKWIQRYDTFAASIADSSCGKRTVDPNFKGYFVDAHRRLGERPLHNLIMYMNMTNTAAGGRHKCIVYANKVVEFLRGLNTKRGATLAELQLVYVLDRFPQMFFMDKVKELTGFSYREDPKGIFGTKTTPSLEFNNEVAAIISQPKTWEELGMGKDRGLMAYYGGRFVYSNKDSVLFQLSPLGALHAVGESWLDLAEGRDSQGKDINRIKAGALLGLNVVFATAEAFGMKAGFGKAVQASKRISAKASSLKNKFSNGSFSKADVDDYNQLVKRELDELSGKAAAAGKLDDVVGCAVGFALKTGTALSPCDRKVFQAMKNRSVQDLTKNIAQREVPPRPRVILNDIPHNRRQILDPIFRDEITKHAAKGASKKTLNEVMEKISKGITDNPNYLPATGNIYYQRVPGSGLRIFFKLEKTSDGAEAIHFIAAALKNVNENKVIEMIYKHMGYGKSPAWRPGVLEAIERYL